MSAAASLRSALRFLAVNDDAAWPRDFPGTKPTSLRELLNSCQDPRLSEWKNPSRGRAENRSFSENAQGIGTDGQHWFISNNANDGREALRKTGWDFTVVAKLDSPFDVDATHIGSLNVRDSWVYVAIQGPHGIWKVSTDFTTSMFLPAEERPDDDMFAWCDRNPNNGMLYTSAFDVPKRLCAYREAGARLERVPDADIPLLPPPDYRPTTGIQGACFTPHHKWLTVCDDSGVAIWGVTNDFDPNTTAWVERIHCHCTITGAFLGRRLLAANTDESGSVLTDVGATKTYNELEDVCVAALIDENGTPVHVHALELNNEELSADDIYLWHFAAPEPEAL